MGLAAWVLSTFVAASGAQPSSPLAELSDFQARCEQKGEKLWGRSLCTPVVIVDPATGKYRTSRSEPGPLPAVRANTALDWNGQKWVMALEPLPQDPAQRASLLFHEAWHAHQEALGFTPNNVVAGHLDDPRARYNLRLEWAALAAALKSRGADRRHHIAQALAFRASRLADDQQTAAAERDQMRHEGLASYTGAALSGAAVRLALEELKAGPRKPSLSRSFAYVSGPAWGLLLDAVAPGWRTKLGGGRDLPDLMPLAGARITRADDYDGTAILGEETLAALERRTKLATALAATGEGRALRLPLAQMSMDFDPNRVSAAPDGSALYEKITLSDRWGRIKVEGVPLRLAPDFSAAFARWPLTAPDTLELAPGWKVEELAGGGARLVPPT